MTPRSWAFAALVMASLVPGCKRSDASPDAGISVDGCHNGMHFEAGRGCVPPGTPPLATPALVCPSGMVSLPGGTYKMGKHPKAPRAWERRDTVTVRAFCIDVNKVTAGAYAECVRSGACNDKGLHCGVDSIGRETGAGSYGAPGKENYPVNCVSPDQAKTFCAAQGKRLPTEEQWEWAARGESEARTYPWGEEPKFAQLCWSGDERGKTQKEMDEMTSGDPRLERKGPCPVGAFPSGDAPGGIHDMLGNLREWTSGIDSATDEPTPVLRGLSWFDDEGMSRGCSAFRVDFQSFATDHTGFRCVKGDETASDATTARRGGGAQ